MKIIKLVNVRLVVLLLHIITLCAILASCVSSPTSNSSLSITDQQTQQESATEIMDLYGSVESDSLDFVSILLGPNEMPERTISLLLPPSYFTNSDKRYPVVYTLHGYGNNQGQIISDCRVLYEKAIKEGACAEFIMVGIDGSNSFYINSLATGKWEDMIIKEIIPLIDQNYRTIPDVDHRIIAGFSMGGFGAWNLALRNADVFCAAWAGCPGAFDVRGLEDAFPSWTQDFLISYGTAFSPDLTLPYPHAQIPQFNGSSADQKIIAAWRNGFGGIDKKIADYKARPFRLKSIRFDYGITDYLFIARGTPYIESQMKSAGLNTFIKAWQSGHDLTPEIVEQGFIPYVASIFGLR